MDPLVRYYTPCHTFTRSTDNQGEEVVEIDESEVDRSVSHKHVYPQRAMHPPRPKTIFMSSNESSQSSQSSQSNQRNQGNDSDREGVGAASSAEMSFVSNPSSEASVAGSEETDQDQDQEQRQDQSQEQIQEGPIVHENDHELEQQLFGEGVYLSTPRVSKHYCSPPSTPNPTGSPPPTPAGRRRRRRLQATPPQAYDGPLWTVNSWKKLSGGLENDANNSCYLNSLVQVFRHDDQFCGVMNELSQAVEHHQDDSSSNSGISSNQNDDNNDNINAANPSKTSAISSHANAETDNDIYSSLYGTMINLLEKEREAQTPASAQDHTTIGHPGQRGEALNLVALMDAVR